MNTFITNHFELLKSLFLKYGIKAISMDRCAKELGISKKTLYENVSNKDELVGHVIEEFFKAEYLCMENELKNSENAIDEMINIYEHVSTIMSNVSHSTIYDLEQYYPQLWKKIGEKRKEIITLNIGNNLKSGQEQGLFREDISVPMVTGLYRFVLTTIIDDNTKIIDNRKEDIYREFIKYHLLGICTEKGRQIVENYEF